MSSAATASFTISEEGPPRTNFLGWKSGIDKSDEGLDKLWGAMFDDHRGISISGFGLRKTRKSRKLWVLIPGPGSGLGDSLFHSLWAHDLDSWDTRERKERKESVGKDLVNPLSRSSLFLPRLTKYSGKIEKGFTHMRAVEKVAA